MWRWSIVLALCCTSCAVKPRDPLAAAQRLADRGDLQGALRIVERAQIGDPVFPAATAMSTKLAERMALAHREVATGLFLRSARQDDEAMRAFRRAEVLWPRMPGLNDRIASVERRVLADLPPRATRVAEIGSASDPVAASQGRTQVRDQRTVSESGGCIGRVEPDLDPAGQRPSSDLEEAVTAGLSAADSVASEELALRLAAVEERLSRGEIEKPVLELMVLYRSHAADQRVRQRLARLLEQRALMRYGGGDVGPAVEDWIRVLEIEPDNREVQLLLVQARCELAGESVR